MKQLRKNDYHWYVFTKNPTAMARYESFDEMLAQTGITKAAYLEYKHWQRHAHREQYQAADILIVKFPRRLAGMS